MKNCKKPITNNPKLNSRDIALKSLHLVLQKQFTPTDALHAQPAFLHMDYRDRAFSLLLLLTTLRRLGQIDTAISTLLDKPLAKRYQHITNILRLGAAQILFIDIPSYAIVNTAVNQTKYSRFHAHKGLVNAVLRRMLEQREKFLLNQDSEFLNTSSWIWKSWNNFYGEKTCRSIIQAQLVDPPLDLTVKADIKLWATRLGGRVLSNNTLRLEHDGPIHEMEGYNEGAWWVQDFAASLPVKLLGNVYDKNIIEIGAAPGGKTAQLAMSGARVYALDRSPIRLTMLKNNLQRLKFNANIIEANAETWRPDSLADGLLLDAPCSTTGTMRRHPDIMWRRKPSDIHELCNKQLKLLKAAVEMIKPGALLVYTVCSLEPEEGPLLIDTFLRQCKNTKRVKVKNNEIEGFSEFITPIGDLLTLPCQLKSLGGLDGFYSVRLRRNL